MKTRKKPFQAESGFTMIELVIAVIIIAILVAILIPILQERAAQAKYTAAKADMEIIAAAQERAAIDTGYMYRLFMLDDSLGEDDNLDDPRVGNDTFIEEFGRAAVHSVPATSFFIDPQTGEFIDDGALALDIFNRLVPGETGYGSERLDITAGKWNGPYMNWSRDNETLADGSKGDDIPNDPWGNNYVLLTQAGIIYESTLNATATSAEPAPTNATMDTPAHRDFDRPTVVSYGPNGVPGNPGLPVIGTGDDLVRQW